MTTFLHSGSLGDVIYSLPSIASVTDQAVLYLRPDVPDIIPAWAGFRTSVRMSRQEALSLIPLLQRQPYIKHVGIYNGEKIDYELDRFRTTGFRTSCGDIARYVTYAYKFKPVLHEPWLTVEADEKYKDCVLVNRTTRYQNTAINYKFLEGKDNVVFVGYKSENPANVTAKDAYELAAWLKGCKGFIGNQSFCFALAEALKVPRLLEVYDIVPNVIIHGANGADAISQELFEEHARDLF